mgnify:CR=1 FL=1
MSINFDFNDEALPDIDIEAFEQQQEERFAQYGDRLYPYVFTRRTDDLNTGQGRSSPIQGQSVEMLNARDLYSRFNQDQYARRTFGDFDNYIGYLDDLLNLAEEHPEIAWWDGYAFRNLTSGNQAVADFYGLEPEDARSGSGARIDASYDNRREAQERFDAMVALPEFQQLVADRGIQTTFNLSGDDVYLFNGLNAAEIYEGNDTFGAYFEQAMDLANRVGLGLMTGEALGAVGGALSDAANAGMLGDYSSSIGEVLGYAQDADVAAGIGSTISGIDAGLDAVDRIENIDDRQITEEEEAITNIGVIDPLLTGDPGDLFEPEVPQIDSPFEGIETQPPENTYTPEFPTTDPQLGLPPRGEEGQGEGESGNGTGSDGEGQQGQGQGEQGETVQTGQTGTTDQTEETREIPNYSGIGDENHGYPDGVPRGGGIYDRGPTDLDRTTPGSGFEVALTVPFLNTGSSGQSGSSSSGSSGSSGGMLSRNNFKFNPFTTNVRGVNPKQVAVIGGQPQRQSIMGMFREYLT